MYHKDYITSWQSRTEMYNMTLPTFFWRWIFIVDYTVCSIISTDDNKMACNSNTQYINDSASNIELSTGMQYISKMISKTDARKIDALDQWCLRMLLGIKWYQFVRNDGVRRLTKQPKLTAIIQSRRLTLFGHIMHMDDNAYAKRILLASLPADWRRQLGRPRITWLSTVQQDLKHHLTLPEAADLAQNRPLWRMMSTYGATQS